MKVRALFPSFSSNSRETLATQAGATLFPATEKGGIKRRAKATNIVVNDFCKICRIYVKISGRSKINSFGSNNKFLKTLSSGTVV